MDARPPDPDAAAPPLAAARRMLAAGDPLRALEVLRTGPAGDEVEHGVLLGDACFLSGRYDEAEAAWRAVLTRVPDDAVLREKLERAAANVATGMGVEEPQMAVFRRYFTREWLLGGPHPGPAPSDPITPDRPGAADRVSAMVRGVAGSALSAVANIVFHGLTARAGRSGIHQGIWTDWHTAGAKAPAGLRPSFQLLKLAFMRDALFAHNLVSPYREGDRTGRWEETGDPPPWARIWRTADGSWNDLRRDPDGRYDPMVGAAWTRFFRNVDDEIVHDAAKRRAEPATDPVNVRALSRALLAPKGGRTEVPFFNVWGAAWIQFMIHDWVSHGNPDPSRMVRVPLALDDPMRRYGVEAMSVPGSAPDPTRADDERGRPPTFVNEVTHWWDGSQLYGSDEHTQRAVRSGVGGRLELTEEGLLPIDPETGLERTGFTRNWWLGLAMLHTVFAREHNAICDHLASRYPTWDDERLFQTARLINAALMAKIHTVEWTPGILPNRTLHSGMRANWFGLLATWFGGSTPKTLEHIPIANSTLGGLVGSPETDFARYGLSEEFTAVYRMHSLLPDAIELESSSIPLMRTRNAAVKSLLRTHGFPTLAGSLGAQNCCALVANNYPAALLDISTPDMPLLDLGALDLLRDRERGVPTYNGLRAGLGLGRVPSFDELTDDPALAATLRELYGTDEAGDDRIDDLDLLIGTLCEGHRPEGFGFGETLFQVFILNASWRLLGDRFYTSDYRPEIYTPEGIEWVDRTSFKDVLLRHWPELEQTGLGNVSNAFEPWDEGPLDPARHPTRAFDAPRSSDPWAGERATNRP